MLENGPCTARLCQEFKIGLTGPVGKPRLDQSLNDHGGIGARSRIWIVLGSNKVQIVPLEARIVELAEFVGKYACQVPLRTQISGARRFFPVRDGYSRFADAVSVHAGCEIRRANFALARLAGIVCAIGNRRSLRLA